MAKAIFKALLTLIANIVSIVMLPVNSVVATAFPDLTSYINTFKTNVAWVVMNGTKVWNYFLNIFPEGIRSLITLYLSILVIKYTITISIHVIIKIFTIIKQVKIW